MKTNPIVVVLGALAAACGGGSQESPAKSATQPSKPVSLLDAKEAHLANARQLTFGGQNAEAYWSWDGTQLIFQSTRPPYSCDQIFRVPVDNGTPDVSLVSTGKGRTTCSYFYPGDRHILFASTHLGGDACPPTPDMSQGYTWPLYDTYDIFSARPDGTELKRLTDSPGYDAEATVCGKDGSIVFTSTRDGDIDLYRMDADGSNVTRLTNTPGYDGGAVFSPDCSKIVWRASRPRPGAEMDDYEKLLKQGLVRPTKLELWVANADGTDPQQITYLDAASFAPAWFPTGDRIIFSTNYQKTGFDFDLWAVNPNGTGLEQITFAPGFDAFPMFSPDGKHLAFESVRNGKSPHEINIFVADWVPGTVSAEERPADRFMTDDAWLADDAREGRGVGSKGLDASADYLADRFQKLGLEPGGDNGTFKQAFQVPTDVAVDPSTALTIDGAAEPGFVPSGFSSSTTAAGDVVFAGYGITTPTSDDYKGVSAKGKIVVVRRFAPDGMEDKDQRKYSDPRFKAWNAREHGAIGLILADLPDQKGTLPEEQPLPKIQVDVMGDAGLPVVFLKRDAAAKLTAGKHKAKLAITLTPQLATVYNVVAKLPGSKKQPGGVLIGAHYDHLGMGGPNSLAPGVTAVHNGADDNASGDAALLEIARDLAAHKGELDRDVWFVAFSAEEMGVLGSTYFTRHPPANLAIKDLVAMLNMDMVGRMREDKLTILGGETAPEWQGLVDQACGDARVNCSLSGGGYGPSDHTPFYASGVPVLHFFTGAHRDYHKPTDKAALINAAGGAAVAGIVRDVAAAVANREAKLTYQNAPAPEPAGDLRFNGASLGTVPDYGGPPKGQSGVLLAGVRPGGPADQAGMKRGDILVGIDGHEIRTVEDFMFVLEKAKPGAKAKIDVVRDGKKVQLDATFGQPTRR